MAQRAEMLEQAVEADLITQVEADLFADVHAALDKLMAEGMPRAAYHAARLMQES